MNRISYIGILLLVAGAVLIYERNGGLAWLGLLLGAGLIVKAWIRPSTKDVPLGLAITALWTLAWAGVFYYVISVWETGEVVELTVASTGGAHTSRTWILEEPGALRLYYDAPAQIAQALLAHAPITVMRGVEPLSFEQYSAVAVNDLPEQEVNRLFGLMSEKYGDRNAATDIFYLFLGSPRDRVGVVVELPIATDIQ